MKPDSGNTPPSDSSKPITASAAFRNRFSAEEYERIEKKATRQLRSFNAVAEVAHELNTEKIADINRQYDDEIKILWDQFHALDEAYRREWEQVIGISYPETPEDWDNLATAVGISSSRVESGDYTLELVIREAHAFILKKRMLAHAQKPVDSKLAYEADADSKPARWFTKATGGILSGDTLRKAVNRKALVQSVQHKKGGEWFHSVEEVCVGYSQHASKIRQTLGKE